MAVIAARRFGGIGDGADAAGSLNLEKSPPTGLNDPPAEAKASTSGAGAGSPLADSRSPQQHSHTAGERVSPTNAAPVARSRHWGWVTIAIDGCAPMVRRPESSLHPSKRLQHLQLWERRMALTSAREHERARELDEQREMEAHLVGVGGRGALTAPKSVFLPEVEGDPEGIAMAFGGVHPGRLGRKGPPVDSHKVFFSVGAAGHYLLHVKLHGQSTALPGSPFPLHVIPGRAHALSTQLDAGSLPLRGYLERWDPAASTSFKAGPAGSGGLFRRTVTQVMLSNKLTSDAGTEEASPVILAVAKAAASAARSNKPAELPFVRAHCAVTLRARDKCGNACMEGGANIEMGCALISPGGWGTRAGKARPDGIDNGGGGGGDPTLHSQCTDEGDGSYTLEWWSLMGGYYHY